MNQELAAQAISPELVLVDTALAVRARADLPWRPWEAHQPVEVVPIPGPPAAPPRGRRFRPSLGVAVLGLGLLAVSVLPTRDRPSLGAVAVEPQAVPRVAPVPRAPRAQVKTAQVTRRPAPAPKPRASSAQRPASRPKAAPKPKAAPTPQPAPAPRPKPQPPPKRTYAWKPFSGAVYYHVSFWRNGAAFYATQTRAARLRLPSGLKLAPGRYRWTVRPAIVADLGIRLAGPIISRAFLVRRD
ncbi:MAG TPA: hypothetical protein VFP24_05565 [Gaiellaceae bacterium]|nr:hypothetical protein [Gaiellaceae bacterium]